MGMARIFGLCAALLFAATVANASTINVGPSNYQNFGPSATHTGGGVQSSFGQQVRLPPTVSGPTRLLPVTRNAVIPYGSIANGAKNFVRINPGSAAASAALTALFLGLDWAFNPETDQWMTQGEPTIEYEDPTSGGFTSGDGGGLFPTASAACAASVGCRNSGACIPADNLVGGGHCRTPQGEPFGVWYRNNPTCPLGSELTAFGCAVTIEGEWENLTGSDWAELEASLPSAPASQVAGAASDIQRRQGAPLPGYQDLTMTGPSSVSGPGSTSTSTDPVTGDTTVTTTNTTTNIAYGDTTITTTNTTTTTNYQNGQETSSTTTTETPGDLPVDTGGGGGLGVWREFCEWASVVCDWLDWTQEDPPPEQDLPAVIDDDFYEEKRISFGAKSCPPPHEVNLAPFMETSVGISFQPLCDFAGLIYYMVMAASYIIAAYISIGVARNA